MSDHSRTTQLLIQDAYLAQLAASAPRSAGFAQLFALNSSTSPVAGENWHALFISPQEAGSLDGLSANSGVRELEAKMIANSLEADAARLASVDCSQLEKLSHLHSSHLRQFGSSSQVFNDVWPDCRPLWMHDSALLARQEVEGDYKGGCATTSGRASMPDQAPEMELSRRLIGASEASCLASTVAECQIEPAILRHVSTAPPQSLAAASEWSTSMNESNMQSRFMEPDRTSEILQYPFDPAFVERAGKFSSFSTENYPGFSEYLPLPNDQRGIRRADAPFEGQGTPKKSVSSLYGLRSDTRAIKLANASPNSLAVTAAKIEKPPNDCIPAGGDFFGADKRLSISGPQLCSPHSVGGKRRGSSQQFEQETMPLGEAATSSPPHAQPTAGDDAETQDALRLKRGRVAQNEENLALLHRKEVKDKDQIPINVSLKRDQNNERNTKMKEEPKSENEVKGKNSKSMGVLSSKTGKNRTKTLADQSPKLDFIHVRARRGQATDSHSLAERVRREKIGERMRLLQDLVPGCNKATGKAMMLDEIINYVQSLQHQVEFLAMKLAALNPRLEINLDSFIDAGDIAVASKAVDSEMTTSAGANLNLRKQDTSVAHMRSDSEANYGLPANITRDDIFAAEKDLNGLNGSGFSHVI